MQVFKNKEEKADFLAKLKQMEEFALSRLDKTDDECGKEIFSRIVNKFNTVHTLVTIAF